MGGIAQSIDLILRGIVLAAFVTAAVIALTHWLVREGRIAPFNPLVTAIRRLSDPVLRPLERTVVRQGRNPQEGPFWLLAIVIVAGIVLISIGRWLTGLILAMGALTHSGPAGWVRFLVELVSYLLIVAIVVRVIGTWIGVGRYTRWMRPIYLATDWLLEPIRRRLPAFGMIDLSPLIAFILILLARAIVFSLV